MYPLIIGHRLTLGRCPSLGQLKALHIRVFKWLKIILFTQSIFISSLSKFQTTSFVLQLLFNKPDRVIFLLGLVTNDHASNTLNPGPVMGEKYYPLYINLLKSTLMKRNRCQTMLRHQNAFEHSPVTRLNQCPLFILHIGTPLCPSPQKNRVLLNMSNISSLASE